MLRFFSGLNKLLYKVNKLLDKGGYYPQVTKSPSCNMLRFFSGLNKLLYKVNKLLYRGVLTPGD
jgi:hypothetical protein